MSLIATVLYRHPQAFSWKMSLSTTLQMNGVTRIALVQAIVVLRINSEKRKSSTDCLVQQVWNAIGERYFEGRHAPEGSTKAVYLADHEMLMACAADAGLDLDEARRVLSTDAYRKVITALSRECKDSIHDSGNNAATTSQYVIVL